MAFAPPTHKRTRAHMHTHTHTSMHTYHNPHPSLTCGGKFMGQLSLWSWALPSMTNLLFLLLKQTDFSDWQCQEDCFIGSFLGEGSWERVWNVRETEGTAHSLWPGMVSCMNRRKMAGILELPRSWLMKQTCAWSPFVKDFCLPFSRLSADLVCNNITVGDG